MIDGVRSATTALKSAQSAGKELGAVVSTQQADIEATVQHEHQAELSAMGRDRQRQIDVLCWCFVAGALITYFLKLYKL